MDQKIISPQQREQILKLAARHGAHNVRIFGSLVRGEARPDSDIDFLVDVAPEHSPWFPSGLILDLQNLLGREVDVLTQDAIHWYIRARVLEEAVPL